VFKSNGWAQPEMPETFLILLCGGVLLAAAVPNPVDVTLHWLRLAGIIALCLAAASVFFYVRRETPRELAATIGYAAGFAAVLVQLAFVQVAWRRTQRLFCLLAYLAAVAVGLIILPAGKRDWVSALALAGIAAMTGLAIMDMLLGHAYLTASRMTMKPFTRLNLALAVATLLRLLCATALVYLLNQRQPVPMLWGLHGLFILTRLLVGLAIPAVFIYMAHDCIRRRATQSATGILYVCGVLVFIGELIALPHLRDTGLPF
jgi:hypothetical protein